MAQIYPTGPNRLYPTIADARSAVDAAVGSTYAIEDHIIELEEGVTFTETVTLSVFSVCAVNMVHPLIIRTESGFTTKATIDGNVQWSGPYGVYTKIQDVIFDPSRAVYGNDHQPGMEFTRCEWDVESGVYAINGAQKDCNFVFNDCDISTAAWAFTDNIYDSKQEFNNCRIRSTFSAAGDWGLVQSRDGYSQVGQTIFRNCRLDPNNGNIVRNSSTVKYHGSVEIEHCTIINLGQSISDMSEVNGKVVFKNNVVHTGTRAFYDSTSDSMDVNATNLETDGNCYFNVDDIFTSTASGRINAETINEMQAYEFGWETNSFVADPDFISTTWGEADWLRPTAQLALVPNCGVKADAEGTVMTASMVEPGALQYAAHVAPTAAQIIEAGGGTYHEATTAEVAKDVTFGPSESYTGTYDPTTTPDAPTLSSPTPGDGQVALVVALNDDDHPAYIQYGLRAGNVSWSALSEDCKAAEDGTVTVTGLTNLCEYVFRAVSKSGTIYSLASNEVFATPRTAAQAEGVFQRDAIAAATLAGLQSCGAGVVIGWKNEDSDESVEIWASIDSGAMRLDLRHGGETDTDLLVLTVPRQTGFPPAAPANGAKFTLDGHTYMVENLTPARGTVGLSPTFTMTASRWRSIT